MSYGVRTLWCCAAVFFYAGAALAEPSASDRATARVLADEGGEALDQKKYDVAADRFGRADALVHAPTLLLGLARAQVGLRKFVEAQENYQRIVREGVAPGAPPSFAKALADAQRELKAIAPKLAWVTISLKEPATSTVTVDGVELPRAAMDVKRAVNPGSHVVAATADGYSPTSKSIELKEGESTAVALALDPAPKSEAPFAVAASPAVDTSLATSSAPSADAASGSSQQKTFGLVALGVGATGLIVGGVTGLMAMSRHSKLESDCPNGHCPPGGQDTIDGFRSMATVSTIAFIVGGVGAAAGGTLLLTAPRPAQSARVDAYVGVGSVGVRGTF